MICAIMQPTFNPWIGYFDMIDQSDVFVLFDDVQLVKRSWQVRNRIKIVSGEHYLNVPIKKSKHRNDLLISESIINLEENWKKKHLASIYNSYRKSIHFDQVYNFLEGHYSQGIRHLGEFNGKLIIAIAEMLRIETQIVFSSELTMISGQKDQRLLSICKKLQCDSYLSAQGSAAYIEFERQGGALVAGGVEVNYHFYDHPIYKQLYEGFIPYLGVFDILFNVGFENGLKKIKEGRLLPIESKIYRANHVKINEK